MKNVNDFLNQKELETDSLLSLHDITPFKDMTRKELLAEWKLYKESSGENISYKAFVALVTN